MNEYEKMTDEELRIEIAKAKGWSVTGVNRFGIRKPGNNYVITDDVWTLPDGTTTILVPSWPTDIAAAWELIVEAQNARIGCDLFNIFDGSKVWYGCTLFDPPGGPMPEEYGSEAPTAPRAICLAYLAWKQSQK